MDEATQRLLAARRRPDRRALLRQRWDQLFFLNGIMKHFRQKHNHCTFYKIGMNALKRYCYFYLFKSL